MSLRSVWLWLPLLMACWLGLAGPALADVDVQLQVGAAEVAVGETLDVQLDAMSSDDQEPSSPELVAPNSFQVRGPSTGSRQQVSINGFHMVRQVGISASWQLTPTRAGVYTIGPASVQAGGHRQATQTVQIRVLPEGQRAQRRQNRGRRTPGGFTPFDPFNDNDAFEDLFDQLRNQGRQAAAPLPSPPEGLVPAQLPDSIAFLDVHVDTTHAVVGQQVTLSIYAHGSEGLFQEAAGAREPTTPDFLSERLVEDGSRQPVYQYERDGQRWIAVKVRELALFPIRAGQLVVGPLEFGFLGRRYGMRNGQGLQRQSQPVTIDVSEPPAQGRPAGYAGDVGDFSLGAVVQPRQVAVGGSIAVTAYVKGRGRLPGALKLPEQAGVEWLEPTLRDDPSTTGSTIGGARTFNYVVRMTRSGVIDLGNLTLVYYSPTNRRYRVVPTALGQVTVQAPPPGAAAASQPPSAGPKLSELVKFRTQIEPRPAAAYWVDRRAFYWLLGVGPALLIVAAGLRSLLGAFRRRLARRGESPAEHATRALTEARQALERGEWGNVASAAERALYLALEWATGLRARAFLRAELASRLTGEGLPQALATEVVSLLDRCSELRRGAASPRVESPETAEGVAARELLDRAQTLVKQLVRRAPLRRPASGGEEEARA